MFDQFDNEEKKAKRQTIQILKTVTMKAGEVPVDMYKDLIINVMDYDVAPQELFSMIARVEGHEPVTPEEFVSKEGRQQGMQHTLGTYVPPGYKYTGEEWTLSNMMIVNSETREPRPNYIQACQELNILHGPALKAIVEDGELDGKYVAVSNIHGPDTEILKIRLYHKV